MPRNKYPEETRNKILQTAGKLFVEKGFENTSIQDILDELGGLTKGAIYHHFKSKEDIMLEILDVELQRHDVKWLDVVPNDEQMSGLEKLKAMFRASVVSPRQAGMFRSAPKLLNNPKMLTLLMQSIHEEVIPMWIEPIVREGVADGSIQTQYPRELAELVLLLANLWVTPLVFETDRKGCYNRIMLYQQMMKSLGADFLDEELISRFMDIVDLYFQE